MTPEESIKFQRDESSGEFKSTPLITAYFEVEKRKWCTYSERWCFRRKYINCFERHIFEGKTYSQTEIHILERNGSRNFDDKALLWGPLRGPMDEKESWWKTFSHIWMENKSNIQQKLNLHIVRDGLVICRIAKEKSKKDI